MSRLSNSIVATREAFVSNLFQENPDLTIAAANSKLIVQPEFGLNKKMALKRMYAIREKVVANQQEVVVPGDAVSVNTNSDNDIVVCNGQMVPPNIFAVTLNSEEVGASKPVAANTNTEEPAVDQDLLAAIA